MPIVVENKLKARARKKGFKGKRFKRYVYGTMNKLGLLEANPMLRRLVELAAKIDLGEVGPDYSCPPCESNAPRKKNFPSLYISGRKTPVDIPLKGRAMIDYRVTGRSMNQRGEEEARHSTDIEIHSIEPLEEEEEKEPKEGEPAKLLHDLRKVTGFGELKAGPGKFLRSLSTKRIAEHGVDEAVTQRLAELRKRKIPAMIVETLDGPRIMRVSKPRTVPRKFSSATSATEFDNRQRNDMGQFIANQTEGVDPNSMAAAYGPPGVTPVDPFTPSHLERIKRFFTGRRVAADKSGLAAASS